jgi:prepilin peptidase CpaA
MSDMRRKVIGLPLVFHWLTIVVQAGAAMTIPVALHLLPLAGFAGLMATAAWEDLRRLVIPNGLVLGLCLLWPFHVAIEAPASLAAAGGAALCAAAVFLAGAVLFSHGSIGGGDVKLLAAATLWAGPAGIVPLLVLTGLLGGVLCLALLTPIGALVPAVRGAKPILVPYGVAIAAAALLVIIPSNFHP